jgi:hypothetical protein
VKKDRGSNRRLFGPEQRKKHAAVGVLSEKEGSPSCGYPCCTEKLKNLGKGEKRQFLLREKKNPECAIQQNTRRQNEKKTDSRLHNSLFNNRFLVARREFFLPLRGSRTEHLFVFADETPSSKRDAR